MTDKGNSSTRDTTPTGYHKETPYDQCSHIHMVASKRQLNCQECGVYIPNEGNDYDKIYTLRETTDVKFFAEVPLGDVMDEMKTIMHINRVYKPKPNYIRYRRHLADWMCEVGEVFNLSHTTVYHAIALMDTFFSKVKDVERTTEGKHFLQLVAITSIFISAKF